MMDRPMLLHRAFPSVVVVLEYEEDPQSIIQHKHTHTMKRAPYSKDRCKALCGGGCCEQSCPRVSTFIIPSLTKHHQEVGKWIQNLRETRGTMAWDPAQKEKSGLDGSQRLHRCVTCFILSRSAGTGKRWIGWD